MSHVDLYLEKFSSIYYIGQNFVIREPIPFDLYIEVFTQQACIYGTHMGRILAVIPFGSCMGPI